MNHWISVDDYLPECLKEGNCSENVFVLSANGNIGVDYYIRGIGWKHDGGPVAYWCYPPTFPNRVREGG
jgi:hypothetical protein